MAQQPQQADQSVEGDRAGDRAHHLDQLEPLVALETVLGVGVLVAVLAVSVVRAQSPTGMRSSSPSGA